MNTTIILSLFDLLDTTISEKDYIIVTLLCIVVLFLAVRISDMVAYISLEPNSCIISYILFALVLVDHLWCSKLL